MATPEQMQALDGEIERKRRLADLNARLEAQGVRLEQPGWLRRTWEGAKDLVTGASRRSEDLPEFGDAPVPDWRTGAKVGWGLFTTTNDDGRAEIITKNVPGASSEKDEHGNTIITYQGRRYYLNRPGFSLQDLPDAAGEVTKFWPAARLTRGMTGLTGMAMRGGGFAATSVAGDFAGGIAGSEQGIDLPAAGINAVLGAGEVVLAPILSRVMPTLKRLLKPTDELVDAQGNLTVAGRKAAEVAGLDLDQIDKGFARSFADEIKKGLGPAAASKAADAKSLPVTVPLSRGQVTGSPRDQMFESMAEKGALGAPAETMMRGFRTAQDEALAGNEQAIRQRLAGGGVSIDEPWRAGAKAQETLVDARKLAKREVDQAYDAARATSAGVPAGPLFEKLFQLKGVLAQQHDLLGLPRTSSLIKDLDRVSEAGTQGADGGSVMVRSLFDWRKRAVNARDGAMGNNREEVLALGRLIKGVDIAMGEMIDRALVQGDERTIELFRKAIKMYRDYAATYNGGDLVARLTELAPRNGGLRLDVAPDQAVNVIFGSHRLFGNATVRDLVGLRKALGGADAESWRQLKEAAFLRLVDAGQGEVDAMKGGRIFRGVKFAGAVDDALRNSGPVMRTMFSEDELALIQQFKRVAAQVHGKVRGGDNTSNTAVAAAGMIQRLLDRVVVSQSGMQRMLALPFVRTAVEVGMLGKTAAALREGAAVARGVPGVAIAPPIFQAGTGSNSDPRGDRR